MIILNVLKSVLLLSAIFLSQLSFACDEDDLSQLSFACDEDELQFMRKKGNEVPQIQIEKIATGHLDPLSQKGELTASDNSDDEKIVVGKEKNREDRMYFKDLEPDYQDFIKSIHITLSEQKSPLIDRCHTFNTVMPKVKGGINKAISNLGKNRWLADDLHLQKMEVNCSNLETEGLSILEKLSDITFLNEFVNKNNALDDRGSKRLVLIIKRYSSPLADNQ